MQTAFIVTQRFPIVDIDGQPTVFSVTQLSPIIAHVNMYANRFYRHTTSHYSPYQQSANYFQRHTMFPYYRSCEHARK